MVEAINNVRSRAGCIMVQKQAPALHEINVSMSNVSLVKQQMLTKSYRDCTICQAGNQAPWMPKTKNPCDTSTVGASHIRKPLCAYSLPADTPKIFHPMECDENFSCHRFGGNFFMRRV